MCTIAGPWCHDGTVGQYMISLDGESATTTIGADIGGRGAEMVFGELR